MTKTSHEIEKDFIENMAVKTGKELKEWMLLLKKIDTPKRNELVNWLKTVQNLKHTYATMLTAIYLNNGKSVYGNSNDLLENQISKYEIWRPLFETVSNKILHHFPEVKMIPKKTYVSFTAKREFAAINIKSKELRLGMDLGEIPYDGKLEKAKLTGPMPRISHMVILKENEDFSDTVLNWLNESYNRINK